MENRSNGKRAGIPALLTAAALVLCAGCGQDADYGKYVTLGDYHGLEVAYEVEPVTDAELAEYEQENVEAYAEFEETDEPLQMGDMAEVLLTATETDGEMLYDFSDGYEMVVGDEEFDAPVDEALLGAQAGDVLNLTVTHDSEYTDIALSGKTVDYHIEVQSVSKVVIPEVTDAFVQENFDASDVESWHESNRAELAAEHEEEAEEQYRNALVEAAVDAAQISGYPKALYEKKKQEVDSGYQSYLDMISSDMTLPELYQMLGTDEKEVEQEYLSETNRAMVLAMIREAEHITLSDEEWQERLSEYAEGEEYDSVEELLADYDETSLREYFLDELTIDALVSYAASK